MLLTIIDTRLMLWLNHSLLEDNISVNSCLAGGNNSISTPINMKCQRGGGGGDTLFSLFRKKRIFRLQLNSPNHLQLVLQRLI